MKNNFRVIVIAASMLVTGLNCNAQFSPPEGQIGTTAMYKDSSAFVAWANNCNITRGLQDISNPTTGYATVGDSTSALGIAGTTGVVSLGDGGHAVLQFAVPIIDGTGNDFAVFENSFNDLFLELAFVEVSSDGINFFRFLATSNSDTVNQINSFGNVDATLINNLAGKYKGQFGTPFNLSDMPNNTLLNKQAISHIKIIDVVGCLQDQYVTRDANNNKINDPWPTPFASSGFDVDAVGVIHQQTVGIKELLKNKIVVYPNPSSTFLTINTDDSIEYDLIITNYLGEQVSNNLKINGIYQLNIADYSNGVYTLFIKNKKEVSVLKFIKN